MIRLARNAANYQPLTPLTILERAASVFPDHIAVIHGSAAHRPTRNFYRRCRRLASALAAQGIGKNDTVAAMLANTPAMLEAHYGVPMAGGGAECAQHPAGCRRPSPSCWSMAAAKILITDREFSATVARSLGAAEEASRW